MLVSTCNRIEIFAVADSRAAGEDGLRTLGSVAAPHAVCRFEEEALRHLFRVAASLDSMVVGEAQILGQVKEAAAIAQQAGALGPELSKALARATTAAKRVRTETGIARGAVSLSSVAVQLAHKLLGSLDGRSVLLVGAGEMAQLAARELRTQGARELLVANRSPQQAEELAREVGGLPVSLAELPPVLARLRAHAESVARAEVEKTLASLQGLDEKQQKTVRAMASAIINKLLHAPTSRLRAEAGQGPLGEATAALFGLEGEAQQPADAEASSEEGPAEGAVLPLLRNR